jgi:hypothetical protein
MGASALPSSNACFCEYVAQTAPNLTWIAITRCRARPDLSAAQDAHAVQLGILVARARGEFPSAPGFTSSNSSAIAHDSSTPGDFVKTVLCLHMNASYYQRIEYAASQILESHQTSARHRFHNRHRDRCVHGQRGATMRLSTSSFP